jgi:PAS domain S-box-containing protein
MASNGESRLLLAIATVAALVLALDISLELGVAGGVLYVGAIWLALLSRQQKVVWGTAAVCSLLTVIGYFASPAGGEAWKAIVNLGLALFAIWGTAALSARFRKHPRSESELSEPTQGQGSASGTQFELLTQSGSESNLGKTLWIIIGLSLSIHIACLIIGNTILKGVQWPHEPVHAAVEMAGGLIALWVAWMLILLQNRGAGTSFNVWIAGALIGMGLLDGMHAIVHVGHEFVWLHSTATFVGGLLFATVWFPDSWQKRCASWWPLAVTTVVLAFGILSMMFPEFTPRMLVEIEPGKKVFTTWALSLNVIGGIFLFAAAVRMILAWRITKNVDDLLFCLHCSLFGAAAVMFEQSQLWDIAWWGWHGLRLLAFGVALWFVVLTDRRDAQELRRRAIEMSQFSAIIESSDDAILSKTLDGQIVSWNRGAEKLYGYPASEIVGHSISRIIPADHLDEVETMLDELRQGKPIDHLETVRLRSDGVRVDVALSVSPVRDSQGQVVGASVIARDIGQRKELELLQEQSLQRDKAELRFAQMAAAPSRAVDDESEQAVERAAIVREGMSEDASTKSFEETLHELALQSRHLVNSHQTAISYMPDGDFSAATHSLSFSDKYQKYNTYDVMPTGEGIWKLIVSERCSVRMTQEELVAHPMWKNFSDMKDARGLEHPPMRGWLAVPILRDDGRFLGVLQASDKLEGEYEDRDLRLFQRLARMIAPSFSLQDANGEVLRHSRQLTTAKEALERSNTDLQQFAYVASHDLQEPLRAVVGFSQLLEKELGETEGEKAQFVKNIVEGGQRMQTLINDLLEYSRVSRRGAEFESVAIKEIVNDAVRNLDAAIRESQAEIVCDSMPEIEADRRQFIQLFQNLIGNGIKYRTDAPPRIHVASTDDASNWYFSVSDNGIGIDPQFHDQIFVIFKRLHTRKSYPGTGIGLALCHRIVDRHGGSIRVESNLDQGSTFHFTIPKQSDVITTALTNSEQESDA